MTGERGPSAATKATRRNAPATVSLVLGIFAAVFASGDVYTLVIGLVLGLVASVLGIVGLRRVRAGAPGRGVAIAGIVLGVYPLVVLAIFAAEVQQGAP
jgi:hypothetical protein